MAELLQRHMDSFLTGEGAQAESEGIRAQVSCAALSVRVTPATKTQ